MKASHDPDQSEEIKCSTTTASLPVLRYTYQSPEDVLTYVRDHASEGNSDEVLASIDAFSEAFPM